MILLKYPSNKKRNFVSGNPVEHLFILLHIFSISGIDNKFQIAPRTRFFYATNNFLRVSARLPKGIEPINVQWRQARKLIVKKTHPLFSPTLYKGPTGKLFHALDIRTPTIVQSDVYHVSAFNLGGVVHKEFRLILARESHIDFIFFQTIEVLPCSNSEPSIYFKLH